MVLATLLHEPQTWVPDEEFTALVAAGLNQAAHAGFPAPIAGETLWGILNTLANTLIQGFISKATDAFYWIVNTGRNLPPVKWMLGLWDKTVKPALGPVIEVVKSIVNIVFNQILNTIVQPMLSGQTISLSDLFGGESPDTIVANAQSSVSNIGTALDTQSSQLSSVGSAIQSLMSFSSVFSGAGTILEPLIEMTGLGIMSTLFQIIGNIILNSFIIPLFSQFTNSSLENDLNTLSSSFGGTTNLIIQTINLTEEASAIFAKSGVNNAQSNNGFTTGLTGTNSNSGTSKININNVPLISNDPNSPESTPISSLVDQLFQFSANLAVAGLEDNSPLQPFITIIELALNGLMTIMNNVEYRNIAILGLLSTFNNLLGAIKLNFSNSPITQSIIQSAAIAVDMVQFVFTALEVNTPSDNLAYNGLVKIFWLMKTTTSLTTDCLQLVYDLGQTDADFADMINPTIAIHLDAGYSFESFCYSGMIFFAGITAVIVSLAYLFLDIVAPKLNLTSPLTLIQFGLTTIFTLAFFGESIARIYLFYQRMDNFYTENDKLEQGIFLSSGVLDFVEMETMILGLTTS